MSTPEARPLGEERFWHDEQRTCAGCAATIMWDADCQHWWVDYGFGNPPTGTFTCPDGTKHRPASTDPVTQTDAVFPGLERCGYCGREIRWLTEPGQVPGWSDRWDDTAILGSGYLCPQRHGGHVVRHVRPLTVPSQP
ncbi:hypothetical protein [Nocardioides pakistanensis]